MAFDFPANPVEDQQFTPPGGPTYIFKTPHWVASNFSSGALPEAPNDGKIYGRQSLAWNDLTDDFALKAPIASPTFTGDPKAPTPTAGDNDTSIATTAFVKAAVDTGDALKVAKVGDNMSGRLNINVADSTTGLLIAGVSKGIRLIPSPTFFSIEGVDQTGVGSYQPLRLSGSSINLAAKTNLSASATAAAGLNVLPGVAPSAPVNGDFWSTTTGFYGQVNGATVGPLIAEAPNDGGQYVRKSLAWSPVSVPPGTTISDTPPGSPASGQMWWNSTTGDLFIFYVDPGGAPGQWVQVNIANTGPVPPSDGNEYTMCNGVWRLSKQSFQPTGTAGQIITVPATAKMARFACSFYNATAAAQSAFMRVSVDGTTFLSGASDYNFGGTVVYSGSTASPAKVAYNSLNNWLLAPASDVLNVASMVEGVLTVGKGASPQVFGIQWRGRCHNTAAGYLLLEYINMGFVTAAAANAITQLPAFQIVPNAGGWAAGSTINVEWLY